ncbi:TSN3 protein, partial [Polypterus senegalus]
MSYRRTKYCVLSATSAILFVAFVVCLAHYLASCTFNSENVLKKPTQNETSEKLPTNAMREDGELQEVRQSLALCHREQSLMNSSKAALQEENKILKDKLDEAEKVKDNLRKLNISFTEMHNLLQNTSEQLHQYQRLTSQLEKDKKKSASDIMHLEKKIKLLSKGNRYESPGTALLFSVALLVSMQRLPGNSDIPKIYYGLRTLYWHSMDQNVAGIELSDESQKQVAALVVFLASVCFFITFLKFQIFFSDIYIIVPIILATAVAVILFFASFIGCCIKNDSPCLQGMFVYLLVIAFYLEAAAIVLTHLHSAKVDTELTAFEGVLNKYNETNQNIDTRAVDDIQEEIVELISIAILMNERVLPEYRILLDRDTYA